MVAKIDLTGMRFNKLVIRSENGHKGDKIAWLCKCDCGELKTIIGQDLRNGKTNSCGCLMRLAGI